MVCSTAARGVPVLGLDPCPLSHKAGGSIESSPSISTWGTVINGCGRRRGSSGATPGCRPACGGAVLSRSAADGALHASGGHIGHCQACDGRSAAGSILAARHRHVAPADQSRIRDGVVGRATRAGRDQRRAVAGAAGDAVDTRGLNRLGEGHRRQDGSERPGEHRLARPRGAEEQQSMGRTPACACASIPLSRPKVVAFPLSQLTQALSEGLAGMRSRRERHDP
jgi:hypothetical protein